MIIKEFIEKSIEGGWKTKECVCCFKKPDFCRCNGLLLDTKAWEAVGKVEGWDDNTISRRKAWHTNMHNMVEALIQGKTIEEYLETL